MGEEDLGSAAWEAGALVGGTLARSQTSRTGKSQHQFFSPITQTSIPLLPTPTAPSLWPSLRQCLSLFHSAKASMI